MGCAGMDSFIQLLLSILIYSSRNPDCDWKILEAHFVSRCIVLRRALPGWKTPVVTWITRGTVEHPMSLQHIGTDFWAQIIQAYPGISGKTLIFFWAACTLELWFGLSFAALHFQFVTICYKMIQNVIFWDSILGVWPGICQNQQKVRNLGNRSKPGNSNSIRKGSKHGLKLSSNRTSACTNKWKHVKTNFWRIVKSHLMHLHIYIYVCVCVNMSEEPPCKTFGNVSSGLLGKPCPIDLHWCIIGWSHRHLPKAAGDTLSSTCFLEMSEVSYLLSRSSSSSTPPLQLQLVTKNLTCELPGC